MSVHLPLEHLYLHFPFCTGRCGYCAFVSGPPPPNPSAYVDALLNELSARQLTLAPLATLYCGGGTPGLLGEKGFRALRASGLFTLAKGYEWTVELHPRTVTHSLMEALSDCGVTRISIGVQSLNDAVLRLCNRRHTAAQALDAVRIARQFIPDTGIDLIAGLPGVSPMLWRDTLQRVRELSLPHLSIYALSIDSGSAWAAAGIPAPESESVCDAIAEAAEHLAGDGLERYETSNYARAGFRCRHNLNTWHGGDYVGLGHGAASRIATLRRGTDGCEEHLSEIDDALERALTTLRLSEGFHLPALAQRFPCLSPFMEEWAQLLETFRHHGLLNGHYAPTLRGYEVLDAMERTLLSAAIAP